MQAPCISSSGNPWTGQNKQLLGKKVFSTWSLQNHVFTVGIQAAIIFKTATILEKGMEQE